MNTLLKLNETRGREGGGGGGGRARKKLVTYTQALLPLCGGRLFYSLSVLLVVLKQNRKCAIVGPARDGRLVLVAAAAASGAQNYLLNCALLAGGCGGAKTSLELARQSLSGQFIGVARRLITVVGRLARWLGERVLRETAAYNICISCSLARSQSVRAALGASLGAPAWPARAVSTEGVWGA